jgi:cytochrome c2
MGSKVVRLPRSPVTTTRNPTNSGIVWDEATFLDHIKNPKADIPGTNMVFVGLKDQV